jgi:hypothetical protein
MAGDPLQPALMPAPSGALSHGDFAQELQRQMRPSGFVQPPYVAAPFAVVGFVEYQVLFECRSEFERDKHRQVSVIVCNLLSEKRKVSDLNQKV